MAARFLTHMPTAFSKLAQEQNRTEVTLRKRRTGTVAGHISRVKQDKEVTFAMG